MTVTLVDRDAGNRRRDPAGEARGRFEEGAPAARDDDINRRLAGDDGRGDDAGGCGGRVDQHARRLEAVGVGGVDKLLERPDGRAVAGVHDGLGVTAPAAAGRGPGIGGRIVGRGRQRHQRRRAQRARGVGGEAIGHAGVDELVRARRAEADHGAPQRGGRDRGVPVVALVHAARRGRRVQRPRLDDGGGGVERRDLIPAHAVARVSRRPGLGDADGVRDPGVPRCQVDTAEPIIDRRQVTVRSAGVALVADGNRERGGGHGDRDVRGDRRSRAGIADPPQHQVAQRRVVDAEEIPGRRGPVVVVHALRRVGAGAGDAAGQIVEGGDQRRGAGEHGGLADHPRRAPAERGAGGAELVGADIERRGVDAERRRVGGAVARQEVVVERREGPHRRGGDGGAAARGNHYAPGHRVGRHGDEPAARQAIETNASAERRAVALHAREEGGGLGVQHAVAGAGLDEAPDEAVGDRDELRRPGGGAAVGRERGGIRKTDSGEGRAGWQREIVGARRGDLGRPRAP